MTVHEVFASLQRADEKPRRQLPGRVGFVSDYCLQRKSYWTVTATVVFSMSEPLAPVTVTVYVPAVVPAPPVLKLPAGLVQPFAAIRIANTSSPNRACQLRRRLGKNKKISAAKVMPPPRAIFESRSDAD